MKGNDSLPLSSMSKPLYLYIAVLLSSAESVSTTNTEWTFQLISTITSLRASTIPTYLYQNCEMLRIDCFLRCLDIVECTSVFVTKDCCYCSSELTPYTLQLDTDTLVYFKRPVHVCTKPGYIYYKDVCFRRSIEDKTWQGAKLDCELTGGWLIVLDSPEKTLTVCTILETYYPIKYNQYFVGASDIEEEGVWTWITNQSSSNMVFRYGGPNNIDWDYRGQEADCAAVRIDVKLLVDEYCLQTKPYVCEDNS